MYRKLFHPVIQKGKWQRRSPSRILPKSYICFMSWDSSTQQPQQKKKKHILNYKIKESRSLWMYFFWAFSLSHTRTPSALTKQSQWVGNWSHKQIVNTLLIASFIHVLTSICWVPLVTKAQYQYWVLGDVQTHSDPQSWFEDQLN